VSRREPSQTERRRAAFLFGLRAESAAAIWLRLKSYRILARRYSALGGEIDLIASGGDVIVFVEVKAGAGLAEATAAITADKKRRMSRAARHWLARHPGVENKTWRGDAVFLMPWKLPAQCQASSISP
jgi:putative endonuclease